ncbi:MAG: F0F1 ATP synthase subunit epsilon [Sphingomonas sp.]|uniref:F0F1 ATP synthase subunit epsilon n=1 Tax=Sphingomonas sp. TaxID=28214 RepID=UPI003565FBD8
MRLRIVTPLAVVVDEDALAVRAEDATGSFGILPGHADFLTHLAISVVGWKRNDGSRRYCAVRRGMLSISDGHGVAVATREAIVGDDLATLDSSVLKRFRADIEQERSERFESLQLQINAVRRIVSQLGSSSRGNFS